MGTRDVNRVQRGVPVWLRRPSKRLGALALFGVLVVGVGYTLARDSGPPRAAIEHPKCRWEGNTLVVTATVTSATSRPTGFQVSPGVTVKGLGFPGGRDDTFLTLRPGHSSRYRWVDTSVPTSRVGAVITACAPTVQAEQREGDND